MLRSGRANWIVVVLGALFATILFLLFGLGESPLVAANRFLIALAKQDLETVSEMSFYSPERPQEQVRADWEKTLGYIKHFRFTWQLTNYVTPAPDRATVRLKFVKDAHLPGAYDENFGFDLVKVKGKWQVDVGSLSREMLPALPR